MSEIENKIRIHYSDFTNSEKKVANFIMNQPARVPLMTMASLSKATNVGEATILRFLKKIGFFSYKVFQFELGKIFNNESKNDNFSSTDFCDEVYKTILTELRATHQLINISELKKAVELIHNSKHIYLCGIGYSGSTAELVAYSFTRLSLHAEALQNTEIMTLKSMLIDKDSLIIALSASGSTPALLDFVKEGKQRGCRIIAVTATINSSLSRLADISLNYRIVSDTVNVHLLTGQMYVMELLRDTLVRNYPEHYINVQIKMATALLNK